MPQLNLETVSLATFAGVYVSGLLTSLTPCVYPIIPIVVGYLGSRKGSAAERFAAGLMYILGLSTVYSALGMAAALTGTLFGTMTANTWVYLAFGVLMLFMGGSMMDWYYIPLPNLPGLAPESLKESPFVGPLLLGRPSGLVASPCTAPVLGSLLLFVASGRSPAAGAALMFTFSLGLSTMLLALGFFAGSFLPRSGPWMVRVKQALALVIIAAGIYFIYTAGTMA